MNPRYGPLSTLAAMSLAAAIAFPAHAGFTGVPQFGNRTTISVAWADYDLDGDLDLAVGNHGQQNQLFRNDGGGSFAALNAFGSGATFAVLWGDFDNDGDPDMAVGRGSDQGNRLFVNNGDGSFTQRNEFGAWRTIALAWADYDLDGDLDLAVGNGILGVPQQNTLYVNDGAGTFTGEPQFGQGQTDAVAWGDFNGDGYPDLAVGNGGFGYTGQNYLYVNNGDGTFTEHAEFGTGDTASLAWGDYDNDGDLDLAVGNWETGRCYLYINNGNGTFAEQPQFGDRDTNTLSWGDADNGGDLDLAVGNGDFASADTNFLYINDGAGGFAEQPEFGLGSTDAIAWGDYDGDGDLDAAVGNEHTPSQNYLYVNDTNNAAYLVLHLEGQFPSLGAGYSNRDALGAKVYAYRAGHLGEASHLLGFREIEAHGGFAPQNAMDAHFGLPSVGTVDVRILWPGSAGRRLVQDLPGVSTGQRITVVESGSFTDVGQLPGSTPARALRVFPNPMRGSTRIELAGSAGAGGAGAPAELCRSFQIWDASGRLVRALRALPYGSGNTSHAEWDGRTADGRLSAPGIYFARAEGTAPPITIRFVLVR